MPHIPRSFIEPRVQLSKSNMVRDHMVRDHTFAFSEWHGTFNITVSAAKRKPLVERADRVRAAKSVLGESLVDQSASERRLLSVWLAELGVEQPS